MMYLETPPRLIETKIFSAMSDSFRRKGVRMDWAVRGTELHQCRDRWREARSALYHGVGDRQRAGRRIELLSLMAVA